MARGIITIQDLENEIVAQDDRLRKLAEFAALQKSTTIVEGAMLEALCCIHERLGNMFIQDRAKGTN